MKPQEKKIDTNEYQQLYDHQGSKNYEIKTMVPKENNAKYFLIDSISKILIIDSYFKTANKEENTYEANKLDLFGNITDQYESFSTLLDGTMKGFDFYSNWIINGDTTRHKFKVHPLTTKYLDKPEKWLQIFEENYADAESVYYDAGGTLMKKKDGWHEIKGGGKIVRELGINITKKLPEKYYPIRMVELKDQFPNLYVKPEERDTSLIKQIKYTSKFFEKSDRGDAFNYSAGWWYFDIYMPGGDTLKIKRFASFGDPEMKLYKIPKELGGREDVLFIIQEPNEIHPEQTGGMYVIRPKNYKETPQYKEQEAKELENEKERKQKESQEAVRKRRSFLPEG